MLFILFALPFVFNCFADVDNSLSGYTYGFWGGVWHGMIWPVSLISSMFSDDVAVWALNNNGGWYTFGFISGVIGLTRNISSTIRSMIK
jgi:hypothetical protein